MLFKKCNMLCVNVHTDYVVEIQRKQAEHFIILDNVRLALNQIIVDGVCYYIYYVVVDSELKYEWIFLFSNASGKNV